MIRTLNSRLQGILIVAVVLALPILATGCFQTFSASSTMNLERELELEPGSTQILRAQSDVDVRTQWFLQRYGSIVRKFSEKYDLDWRLILATMRQESQFSDTARSHRGAFGLMQIMPSTQLELAEKLGVANIESPSSNIKAGIFHLSQLYAAFDGAEEESRIRLMLAAYNAGLNRIIDAQDLAGYLGDDPERWESVEAALPLLSKRYYTLHQNVWEGGKPTAGYFSNWRQTEAYVESIMENYDHYQLTLK